MKNVTPSSGKVLFIVLIALVIVILLAVAAGVFFKKIPFSSRPDPQPVVTRHKMPSPPAQPETEMLAAKAKASDFAIPSPPVEDLKSADDALAVTPAADQPGPAVQTETAQAGDGADEGGDQPLVVATPGTATDTEAMDSQASAADVSKQPADAEKIALQMPESSSSPMDARPTAAAPEVSPAPEALFYSIQVGAFRSKDNASRKVAELLAKGYKGFIVEIGGAKSQVLYAVRFGRFAGKSQAQAPLAEFKQKEKASAFIMRSDQ